MALTKIKNISIDPAFLITGNEINSTFTLTAKTVTVSTPATNTEAANKQYVDNSIANVYNFKTIAVSGQSNVVADSSAATLTFAEGTGMLITTDAATDTVTFTPDATSNNTANKLVIRDGSGNFSAGVITATSLTGKFTNARNISLGGDATGTAAFDGSANITITTTLANTGVTAQTYGSVTQVPEIVVDSKGRITSASNINIAIPSTAITDWQEAVEDTAAGSITSATHSGISFSYDDSNGTLAATVANQNKFDKIAVSGETTVAADTPTDTVTFAGSTGLTITTDATTDVITFTNSGVTSAAVSGVGLSINSATGAITVTSNATALNTASTIVSRDASGDFAAGVITADLVGDVTGDVTGNINSTGSSSFSNITITGGTIDDTIIGGTTPQAITGTTITANTQFSGDLVGDVTGDVNSSGTSTFATVDINGGNIDGTVIGASTPAAADFTNVVVTGSLEVDGGVLYVDPATNFVGINDTTPAAALDVNGDAIVTGSLTVNTNATITGNLTVLGTTTTVESTVTTVVDPVLTVGQGTYGSNDGKARGIEFKYYDGANRLGFFGYDTTDGVFKFLKTASNNSEVFTGTTATLEANLDGYLVNARDIELTGDVTGLEPFDGSANIQISTTLANTGVTVGSYGAVDEVATFTVDSKGRLTAAGIAAIAIPSTAVTDFDEAARDAAALMITSATHTNVSVSYDDGANTLSFSVPGAESFSTFAVSGQTNVVADQANDTITFAGSTGLTITTNATTDTVTFTNSGVTSAAVSGVGLSINAATGAVTISSDATSANTAGTIVARDGSGNFSANVITADLVGNADTASTWATARTITLQGDLSGSVNIDGSSNVNLTATIEPDSVALGTDTTGDYVESISAGSGINITGGTGEGSTPSIDNTDKGSDQEIFKNIAVSGEVTVTADNNNETLTLAAGTGVAITTDNTTKTITITNSGLNAFKYVAVSGQSTVTADQPDDTLTLVGGTAISLSTNATTDAVEITNTGVTSLSTSGVGISVNTNTGAVTLTSDATPANTAGTIVSRDAFGAFNAGDIGAEDITADSISLVNGVTIGGLTATRVVFAGTAGLLSDNSDFTYNSGTNTLGVSNVNATTSVVSPSITDSGLTSGRVTFAGVGGLLSDSSDLTFNSGTTTLSTVNVTGSGTLQGADLKATNLTNTRVVFAGASGLLSDNSDFTYNAGTNTLSASNVNATTGLTTPSITDSGLTAGRVTFAGVGGLLSDDSDLTYNSTTNTLSVPNLSTSTAVNTAAVNVSSLTQGRVVFAGASGALVDDADMTFNTGTNTLAVVNVDATMVDAGDVNIATNVISVASGDLVVAAGTGGHLDVDTHKIVNVVDPTNNQDAATKKYVDDQLNTINQLTIDGDSGGPSSVDIALDTLTVAGTVNEIETSVSGQTITIGLPNDVTIGNNLTVTNDISASGDVSAVDFTASGDIMGVGLNLTGTAVIQTDLSVYGVTTLASVSTTGAVTADSLTVTNNATVGGTLGVTGVVTTTTDVNVGGALGVTGATTVSTITSTGAATLDTLTVTNNASVGGNLTVTGDLTVQGTLTSIQTTNTEVSDNTIILNNGEAGAGVTAGTSGIEIDRGSSDNATLLWNETTDTWEVKVGAAEADFQAHDITATGDLNVTGTLNAGSAQFTAIDNTPIGSTTPSTGAFTTLTSTDLTATRVVFVGGSDELVDDSDFTYDSTTDTLAAPNISASTGITAGQATVSNLTSGRVTIAGASGLLGDTGDLVYNGGTSTLETVNVTGSGTLQGLDVKATSLTSGRVTFAGTGGLLVDDGDLTYNTGTDTLSVPNISMSGSLATTSVTSSSLTSGRVTFAGAGGLLSDDADLTFNTGTDTLATVNVSATAVTAANVTDSALTSGRVTFAGTGGLLSDDANLAFSTGTGTLTATNLTATTTVQGADVKATNLTAGRVTFAGASGLLSDNSDLTYNTGTNTLAATNVSATAVTAANVTDSALTAGRITFAGVGGLLSDDSDLTYNSTTNTLTVPNVDATGATFSGLTQDRIVLVGASGALVDDSGLTYNSTTDTLTTTTVVANLTGNVTGNITGNITGNVTGDLTGDVKAANGTTVLDSGTNGTDATFTGDVTGNVTGQVTDISNHDLDDIGDVDLTGLQDQDTIRWDATSGTWVPSISGGFTMRRQRFTANGSSPSFTLNVAPEGAAYLIVTVSGVPQGGDTFSVTGTTLTLGGTPQNGEVVEVMDFSTGVFSPAPNSTDDISEGSTNFYYTNTRVATFLGNGTLNTHIIPATDITYDLGSAAKRWRDLYLSGNTIHLGAVQIKNDAVAGTLKFVDSSGNPYPVDLGVTLDPDIQIDGGTF